MDIQRLRKQRVEAKQILKALLQGPKCLFRPKNDTNPGAYIYGPVPDDPPEGMRIRVTPWYNHPAVQMWKGYEKCLTMYYNASLYIYAEKGGNNIKLQSINIGTVPGITIEYPPWFGDERVHSGYRGNLLFKNFDFYSQYGWTEEPIEDRFWPTKEGYSTVCIDCGNEFLRLHGNQKICPSCKEDYNIKQQQKRLGYTNVCMNCRKKFILGNEDSGFFEIDHSPEKIIGPLDFRSSKIYYCSHSCKNQLEKRFNINLYKPKKIGKPDRPSTKEEVCHEIYNLRHDPNSIMDIIEDWTGITCRKKDDETSDD